MGLIAIISDIHGNFEALKSVFADIDAHNVSEVICLGDLIGYGPQPQECVDLARERGIDMVQGNHEQGLINIHYLHEFNQPAKDALRKTREMIADETYEWLVKHPKSIERHGCRFVHGTPPRSTAEYIWKYKNTMGDLFARFNEFACFVGHTHELKRYTFDGTIAETLPLPQGETMLEPELRHIVNLGAVGQPRDGDNSAKYALFNPETRTLTIQFIPYDIKKTAELIRARGFHRAFADRLW